VAAGTGTPEAIDVSSGITSDAGQFNLNGIVASDDELIVVQSNSGELFRITFAGDDNTTRQRPRRPPRQPTRVPRRPAGTPTITKIDLGAATVKNGDGLLLDRGRLLVVRGSNGATAPAAGANGLIDVVKLSRHRTRGRVGTPVFDASFSGPSTVARAGKRLLVVNASFQAGPTLTATSRSAASPATRAPQAGTAAAATAAASHRLLGRENGPAGGPRAARPSLRARPYHGAR
jgi:hypothetical protein